MGKSEGRLGEPARWRCEIWYRLGVVRNVVTRGLEENWPRQSFSKDCTQVEKLDGMI